MSAQKLYGPEIPRFSPCMVQFLDNIQRLLIFSNYTGEIDYFWLDFLKMCNINAGPSVNFLFVDHIKDDHNEQELNR